MSKLFSTKISPKNRTLKHYNPQVSERLERNNSTLKKPVVSMAQSVGQRLPNYRYNNKTLKNKMMKPSIGIKNSKDIILRKNRKALGLPTFSPIKF